MEVIYNYTDTKPSKPTNAASSYRPISLLPVLVKLFERLVLKKNQTYGKLTKRHPQCSDWLPGQSLHNPAGPQVSGQN